MRARSTALCFFTARKLITPPIATLSTGISAYHIPNPLIPAFQQRDLLIGLTSLCEAVKTMKSDRYGPEDGSPSVIIQSRMEERIG